uniref:Uncharacterized protein n=1 Tax=Aegilops tauschii subsp. strangulata TaxID=200361 RepID=A0A453KWB1_AEGTS
CISAMNQQGDGESVHVLPRHLPGIIVHGDGHDEPNTGDHLRAGDVSRSRKRGDQEAAKLGQDIRHRRLRRRRHGHDLPQGSQAAARLAGRRRRRAGPGRPASSQLAGEPELGDGRAVPRRQQLL